MDQNSFSVLLSFVQSAPFEGGAISGRVCAVAVTAARAVRSKAIPTTVFFMAAFRKSLTTAELSRSLPKKRSVQSRYARDEIPSVARNQPRRCEERPSWRLG